jgi:hypothetical protein
MVFLLDLRCSTCGLCRTLVLRVGIHSIACDMPDCRVQVRWQPQRAETTGKIHGRVTALPIKFDTITLKVV